MDESNKPKCSHDPDQNSEGRSEQDQSVVSTISGQTSLAVVNTPISFSLRNASSIYSPTVFQPSSPEVPLIIKASNLMPIVNQPRLSGLSSTKSLSTFHQPQSLFLQALSKLNENSLNFSLINYFQSTYNNTTWKNGDLTPPGSLASAPPSYSFVLRQMAARRRPRLMGTFIPSPSFVQHTPPPTYTTAFDIYMDAGPPPTPRVYSFGFAPMPIVCPECGHAGMTATTCRITLCTHLCAFLLCIFCCWLCAPLPYVLRSCKDVYHYCRNCRNYLGMYCPTNPENAYPVASVPNPRAHRRY